MSLYIPMIVCYCNLVIVAGVLPKWRFNQFGYFKIIIWSFPKSWGYPKSNHPVVNHDSVLQQPWWRLEIPKMTEETPWNHHKPPTAARQLMDPLELRLPRVPRLSSINGAGRGSLGPVVVVVPPSYILMVRKPRQQKMSWRKLIGIYYPMDPSTFLGSVWGIIYYNLEG